MSAHRDADDWLPLEPAEHAAQCAALLRLLRGPPRVASALDIGAGDGRIAGPAAAMGARVVALDNDPHALEHCAAQGAEPLLADALDPSLDLASRGPFDAAWCLGHTFLLFHDVDRAAALLSRVRDALAPGGWVALDNFPGPLWEGVSSGDWQEGVSEDGRWQMLWAPGENVVAIRRDERVRPDDWTIRADDRLLRLWTLGDLRLLAARAGLSPPEPDPTGVLLLLRRL